MILLMSSHLAPKPYLGIFIISTWAARTIGLKYGNSGAVRLQRVTTARFFYRQSKRGALSKSARQPVSRRQRRTGIGAEKRPEVTVARVGLCTSAPYALGVRVRRLDGNFLITRQRRTIMGKHSPWVPGSRCKEPEYVPSCKKRSVC